MNVFDSSNPEKRSVRALMRITSPLLAHISLPIAWNFCVDFPVIQEIMIAPSKERQDDLKVGDQLLYYIVGRIGFHHHGVYIGNGTVIHRPGPGPIQVYSYQEFLQEAKERGSGVFKIVYLLTSHEIEVLNRASCGVQQNIPAFSVISYNCEHFASWVATGKAYSLQTDGFKLLWRTLCQKQFHRLAKMLRVIAHNNSQHFLSRF